MDDRQNFVEEYCVFSAQNSLLPCLNDQRKTGKLCDVILKSEDSEYPAHRCILAAASEYFSSMFEEYNFSESTTRHIELQSLDGDALEEILDMIYTGRLRISLCTMHDLLAGTDHLLLNKAKCFCIDFMFKVLASADMVTEALRIRQTAEVFSLPDLKAQAEDVIAKGFRKITKSQDFQCLDVEHVLELIRSDNICEADEFVYFEACIDWIRHDEEKRAGHFDDLMSAVRFALIDSYQLVSTVKVNEYVVNSSRASSLVQSAMEYQLLTTTQSLNQSFQTKPRCNRHNTIIYCLSGINDFRCYVTWHDKWYSLSAPPIHEQDIQGGSKLHIVITSVDGYVYACIQTASEEEVGNFITRAVLKYNIDDNTWTTCAVPAHSGTQCVFVECHGQLLACSRSEIQRYDADNGSWTTITNAQLDPCQFAICDERALYFYNLEEGICQQVLIDQNYKVNKQQIMTPNRFIAEVLGVAKLPNHEIFISQRTITGTTRRIFNLKTNLWRDCCFTYGLATLQPRAGVNFPLCFDPSDQWEAVSVPYENTLYMLSTKSGISDIPSKMKVQDVRKLDGVLPFCKLNLTTRMWTRLASLPERFANENIQLCVSEGTVIR